MKTIGKDAPMVTILGKRNSTNENGIPGPGTYDG